MRLRALFVIIVVLGTVGLAAPSDAGPPGTWTVISGGGLKNIVETGMYRTSDGTLHVSMLRGGVGVESLDVAHVSTSGAFTGRQVAINGWKSVTEDQEIVGSPDGGMRLVFGGIHTLNNGDPFNEGYVYQATAPAAGNSWTVSGTPAVAELNGYAANGVGATTLADGTLVAAYAQGSVIAYQVGGGPAETFTVAQCCVYDVTLVQSADVVYAAWYNNGGSMSTTGEFVRTIYPTLGPIVQVPGSVTSFSGNPGSTANEQEVAMAARNGGGVYIAFCQGYPFCGRVVLWKYGTTTLLGIPGSARATNVAISPAPSGRLWIAFDDQSNDIHAVRTNTSATKFGEVRLIRTPNASAAVFHIGVEGTRARADVVFNDQERIWHQQVIAGLTLKAAPAKWNGDNAVTVKFKVTDAGAAVNGAKVKARWNGQIKTCTTSSTGVCKLSFPKMGKTTIKVTGKKSGYAPDEVRLRVT